MDFYKLCKLIGDRLSDTKDLNILVKAKRDNAGGWSVVFEAKSSYDTLETATSPEGLLMKLQANQIPALKVEDVGLVSKASD